jgi:hypothetical protein
MSKMWLAVPEGARTYLQVFLRMWLSVVGLAAITWGAGLFFLPVGCIVGGFSLLLLDRAIDMTLTKGGVGDESAGDAPE